ncbi:PatU [Richelia intracellularis HH01]|uniref:PatU n=1 Tax=Richelia intracellularis HH01 TaxID=1165094 RepID=M1WZ04_9NOST|nr:PatU [Richelia intracellularis HH01]
MKYKLLALLLEYIADIPQGNGLPLKEITWVDNILETAATFMVGDFESLKMPETFQLGEIPTVQERFQAVLKRRLQIQIENHPPVFPWESQLQEYPDCLDNKPSLKFIPDKLSLPISIPENVFQVLLTFCQQYLTSSLPLGSKLVKVVESIFPENYQELNDIAGLVLRSTSSRSSDSLAIIPNIDSDYSELQACQQMALSLLTAKQLLDIFNVSISATNPLLNRQLLTSNGELYVEVELKFTNESPKILVRTQLPSEGSIKLQGGKLHVMAKSDYPDFLSVELPCTENQHYYTLTVELEGIEEQALLFLIVPTI